MTSKKGSDDWMTAGKARNFFGNTKRVAKESQKPKIEQVVEALKDVSLERNEGEVSSEVKYQNGDFAGSSLLPLRPVDKTDGELETISSMAEAYEKASAKFGIPISDLEISVTARLDTTNMEFLEWVRGDKAEELITAKHSGSDLPLNLETSFKYSPLKPGHFRLLKIWGFGPFPQVDMNDYAIENAPPYIAMSYSWGKDKNTRAFLCNGYSFAVSEHVLDALNHIKPEDFSGRLVWIDAICINQNDEAEKAIQVAKMGTIYSLASQVSVWLGPAENDSDFLLENLVEIGTYAETVIKGRLHPQFGIERPSDKLWKALGHFICRSWFNRVWVVQELLLGKNPEMVCGIYRLEWETLALIVKLVHDSNLVDLLDSSMVVKDDLHLSITNIKFLADSKRNFKPEFGFTTRQLIGLLNSGRYRRVTEPVDRVWAYLGVAQPELREAASGLVDYSTESKQQYHRSYVGFCKLLIAGDNGSYLLSPSRTLPDSAGLPSWCPNFNTRTINGHNVLFHNELFRAGTKKDIDKLNVIFDDDSYALRVKGFRIDIIKDIAKNPFSDRLAYELTPNPTFQEHKEWIQNCLTVSRKLSKDKNSIPYTHWRTLTLDTYTAATEDSLAEKVFRKYQDLFLLHKATAFPGTDKSWQHFCNAVNINASRSFFATNEGRLGRGPPNVVVGDVICVFHGAKVPYLLRFGEEGQPARLVGDVYLDGVMHGEGLGLGEDEFFHIS